MNKHINTLYKLKSNLSVKGLSFLKSSLNSENVVINEMASLDSKDFEIMDQCLALVLDMNPDETEILMEEIDSW